MIGEPEMSKKLAEFFTEIAWKRLKEVEISPSSNQHEFNGGMALRKIFGEGDETLRMKARIIYLCDDESSCGSGETVVTWYNARKKKSEIRKAEYRLYYPSISVMSRARVGDLLVIGIRPNRELFIIIAANGSTSENQLISLLNIQDEVYIDEKSFEMRTKAENSCVEIGYVQKMILDELGIPLNDHDDDLLDIMISIFNNTFPSTKAFSDFARDSCGGINAFDDPDKAIISWMDREESLFRSMERHLLKERLRQPFDDLDEFLKISLSVQNRRKSRVGQALENHIEAIFVRDNIFYSRGTITENRSRPDFLFPRGENYRDDLFPETLLTVLGVKSTCKDRWRQVLSEAKRIKRKHLFTLQPSITPNQTNEMFANDLCLVIPQSVHITYRQSQMSGIISLKEFLQQVSSRQESAIKWNSSKHIS